MANLVTTATIRAVDMLTGPLTAMAGKVAAVNRGIVSSARNTGANVGRAATATGAAAFGLGMMMEKAQDFNKHIFGIGAGQLVDEKTGEARVEFAMHEMERMKELSLDMSRNMRFSATSIAEAGETLVKAGLKEGLEDMMRATVSLAKADTDTPAKNIADFMHTMSVIYRDDYKKGPGDFVRRQADMILTAADQTKLSVGSIMEGMRQFQSVGANLGLKTQDMLPMLMSGVQAGFGASEFGTMLKSDLGRLLKMTGPARSVLSRLQIDINDEKYTSGTQSIIETSNAMRNLRNSIRQYGQFGKGDAAAVSALIEGGARKVQAGDMTNAEVVDRVTAHLGKMLGKTTDKDRAAMRREVEASILAKSGDLNPLAVIQAMMDKGASQADFDTVFEGRHSARNAALRQAMKAGDVSQWKQLLERMHGQGLDGVEALWSKSVFGNVEALKAAFNRLFIVLSNAPIVQSAVNHIERFVDGLGKMSGPMANVAAGALLLGAAVAPAAFLLRALVSPLGMIAAAATLSIGSMENATQIIKGFSDTFMPMLNGSSDWAQFTQNLNDLKQAMSNLFGASNPYEAGVVAANGLVVAVNNVAAAFNGLRDFLEWIGLAQERKKDPNALPTGWERDPATGGVIDKRSGTQRFIDGIKDAGKWWDRTLDDFNESQGGGRYRGTTRDNMEWSRLADRAAGEGRDTAAAAASEQAAQRQSDAAGRHEDAAGRHQDAASQLSAAAQALQQAASSLGNLRAMGNGGPSGGNASAPANRTANPQSYGVQGTGGGAP